MIGGGACIQQLDFSAVCVALFSCTNDEAFIFRRAHLGQIVDLNGAFILLSKFLKNSIIYSYSECELVAELCNCERCLISIAVPDISVHRCNVKHSAVVNVFKTCRQCVGNSDGITKLVCRGGYCYHPAKWIGHGRHAVSKVILVRGIRILGAVIILYISCS